MKEFERDLYQKGEYNYPSKGFIPFIHGYLHEEKEERPAVIVVPGGAYTMVSPTEAEIVALHFYEMGYQAFVLTYTTNMLKLQNMDWQPLEDLARAIYHIRKEAKVYHVKSNQVAVAGFSAGGHLSMSLAVHFHRDEIAERLKIKENEKDMLKPDGVVLSYPVISSGKYGHKDSFDFLLGELESSELKEMMSLEYWVNENTPPVFVWHTMTDRLVPVENSFLLAQKCREKGVPCELHIYPERDHGMSIANDKWAAGEFGDRAYTLSQMYDNYLVLKESGVPLPDIFMNIHATDRETFLGELYDKYKGIQMEPLKADEAIQKWPEHAISFLKRVWS